MAYKFVALFALIAAASAGIVPAYEHQAYYQPAPAVYKHVVPVVKKIIEHEEPANYNFEYAVHDEHTGDIKEQHEEAKNGGVEGYYSLIDADGYKRIVHYTADDHNGFQAKVEREPVQGHKIVKVAQPVIVKKIIAQPAIAVQKYIAQAPQYYSAPAPQYQQYQHSAPSYYHH